jgi:ketosteroid isomerase-like protein
MPQQNVDLARSICAAWERGDFSSADWADPEIDYVVVDGPIAGRWKGISAMNTAWREFTSAWEDFRAETYEYRALDGERVLALGRFSARGKTSGLEIARMGAAGACLFHIRDGKATRLALYFDCDRALADLGLEA